MIIQTKLDYKYKHSSQFVFCPKQVAIFLYPFLPILDTVYILAYFQCLWMIYAVFLWSMKKEAEYTVFLLSVNNSACPVTSSALNRNAVPVLDRKE